MFAQQAQKGVDHIWHFWLAVPLVAATILLIVGLVVGYFIRVTRTRYPQN